MTFAAIAKRIGLMAGGVVLLLVVLAGLQPVLHRLHASDGIAGAVLFPVAVGVYYGYRRFTGRRPPDDVVPRNLAPLFLGGLAGGLALFAAVVALLAAAGMYHAAYTGVSMAIAGPFLLALGAAAVEEVVFRGFLFRTVQDVSGTWVAVGVSAVLFGALHAGNPGATVATSAAIALEAGVLLALAYAASSSLWLPIGIHAGWNFCEGTVFGTSVSGTAVGAHTVFRGTLTGDALFTGGRFGPEASVFAVAVCVVAAAALAVYAVRTQRVVPPAFVRHPSTSSG